MRNHLSEGEKINLSNSQNLGYSQIGQNHETIYGHRTIPLNSNTFINLQPSQNQQQHITPIIDVTNFIETSRGKSLKYQQILAFSILYFSHLIVNVQREFWVIGKNAIQDSLDLEKFQFGYFDGASLSAQFIGSMVMCRLSDKYCKRKILTIVYIVLILSYILIFLGGYLEITNIGYYFFVFVFNGWAKALMFPCVISILSEWFSRKHRGLIFGFFMTSISFGYLAAIWISQTLSSIMWYWIILFNSGIAMLMALLIFFCLKPDPINVGYVIDEFTDKERKFQKMLKKAKRSYSSDQSISPSQETVFYRVQTESNYNSVIISSEQQSPLTLVKLLKHPQIAAYSGVIFLSRTGSIALFYYLSDFFDSQEDLVKINSSQYFSISLNVGTILGGIFIGYISDLLYSKRSPVILVAIIISTIINIVIIFEYHKIGNAFFAVMLLLGFLINGFSNLIYSNCSTDIGKSLDIQFSQGKVLATTVCIIESFGALGSSIGIFLIGQTSRLDIWGYKYGYWVIITVFIAVSIIPLSFVFQREFIEIRLIIKNRRRI
ncbi:sugar phosphate exchanger 3 [Stylonychia lemnae]|uniref:Sugar phosphate exchanger 3 n=1 Tax=Stylonychia lemnae TaxID=5949 RepID=A0A078A3I1_STYLE|nr:sugar phosphate exchanger 3 [Stylonychia lemnae]|eukprot:CDW76838.1 sugar phosphate exchanger 3 [Stylonychia lemnae]